MSDKCRVCDGEQWVCENHFDRPWDGLSNREDACGCGPGMPCGACDLERAAMGYSYRAAEVERAAIVKWLRDKASDISLVNARFAFGNAALAISRGAHLPSAGSAERRDGEAGSIGAADDIASAESGGPDGSSNPSKES